MKVGDLVKLKTLKKSDVGLVTKFIEKKCWRTDTQGNKVDWNKVEPEPHAVVLVKNGSITIPVVELEIVI